MEDRSLQAIGATKRRRDYRVQPRGAKTVELNPGIGGNIVVECRRGHRCGLSSWDHCRGVMSGLSVVETVIAKSQFRIVKHRRVRLDYMLRHCYGVVGERGMGSRLKSIGLETVKPL